MRVEQVIQRSLDAPLGPWPTWSRGWHPCPRQGGGTRWSLSPFQLKMFYNSMRNHKKRGKIEVTEHWDFSTLTFQCQDGSTCVEKLYRGLRTTRLIQAVLSDVNFPIILLVKVGQEEKKPQMYLMVRDKKSIWTICNLYNPFSNLCNTISDINAVGA